MHLRWLLFFLLTILSTIAQAGSADTTRIETRYGVMDVVENSDTVDIRFQGKVLRSVEALGASLYRVTPKDQREFVIVDNLTPGLNCHHVFVLVELHADGKAWASEPFGECKELEGVEFHAESPVVHLSEPQISGRRKSSVTAAFEWRNGKIVELPGIGTAQLANSCAVAAGVVEHGSSLGNIAGRMYKVAGQGRLQFLSAPRAGCEQAGVFLVTGDTVRGYQHVEPYTFVHYVNPKSGKSVQGWVLSSRLVEAGSP